MIDYPALRALALIAQSGSFEGAAAALRVTPSAISQRIKLLEERSGSVLVTRASPCRLTEAGQWLCQHMEQVQLLEAELHQKLPQFSSPQGPRAKVSIAVNADSLATWFLPAMATFAHKNPTLLDLRIDDQDHTADWLRRGQVTAAVTSHAESVAGCQTLALGRLRYLAVASPAFVARHFPQGVSLEAIAQAPMLRFDHKDLLQQHWIEATLGRKIEGPTHWLPSAQGFLEGARLGLGWGMNPWPLVAEDIAAGRLVALVADRPLDTPLYWQISRLVATALPDLTQAVVMAARAALVPAAP